MATYLIGYDLNRPGQNYASLEEAIQTLAENWWRDLDSTWIINHSGPANVILDALSASVDGNDKLLVVKLTGEGAWKGFDDASSGWIERNL